MRLLMIGGSGRVGTMVRPYLGETHEIHVLDVRPPTDDCFTRHTAASSTDFAALERATRDADALVYMAMGPDGAGDPEVVAAHFDGVPKGLHLALRAAAEAGVRRAVNTSSLSVYRSDGLLIGPDVDKYPPPDSTSWYGLTKRLGEQVCEAAAAEWGMTVVALRLYMPRADDEWERLAEEPAATCAVAASDLAAAINASLVRGDGGFHPYPITGDHAGRFFNQTLVRRELGYQPRRR